MRYCIRYNIVLSKGPIVSSMIYRLARACYRHAGRVIALWALVLAVLAGLTATVGGNFDDQFRIPGATSQTALDQMRMTFPQAAESSASVLVLAPKGDTVNTPSVRAAVEAHAAKMTDLPWVSYVMLPYDSHVLGMISDDGTAGLLSVRAKDGISTSTMTDAQREMLFEQAAALQAAIPGSEVHVGGELFAVSLPKVTIVDLAGVGVAIIVLVIVLGSLWASLMPILLAVVGAAASLMLIKTAAGITPINSTTMILALMLALAVGIDYALFIVSRHRDQLAAGMEVEESACRATATSGAAVVFAGLTVIVALAGLAISGIPFLGVMGAFAAASVAIEVALALTLLPAMLGLAGDRLRSKKGSKVASGRASHWWVGVVTKWPAVTIAAVVLVLGALAIPAKDLTLALPNSGTNAPGSADRVTYDLVAQRFGVGYNGPLIVTGTIVESTDPLGIIDGIKADIQAMPGVKLVAMAVPNLNADTMLIQVIPTTGPDDHATIDLVRALQNKAVDWKSKYNVSAFVTGYTAVALDVTQRLADALLPFAIFVVGLSLVLLTMVFRSIWVPIKAALGYLLSVGAAFGIVTLVFNKGVGRQIINLPEAVPVISFMPIILMGILFGLAMDYEVFLTSRMREEYVHGNHTNPTEEGFVHSAKVVIAAALIMVSVFGFFVPASDGAIKPIAFGLAIGVAIDAFVVRMTLGPAVMKLLHGRAWWLPRILREKMPVMDVEGEVLAHQLRVQALPAPDAPETIYGQGLAAVTPEGTLFEGVDLDVSPGQTLVVSGATRPRVALLLALSGRTQLTSGDLRLLGLAMPEQGGQLRRRATFVEGTSPDAARALGRPSELIVVNDADRLDAAGREALDAILAQQRLRPADAEPSETPVPTIVLGTLDPAGVPGLTPDSHVRLGSPAPALVAGGAR